MEKTEEVIKDIIAKEKIEEMEGDDLEKKIVHNAITGKCEFTIFPLLHNKELLSMYVKKVIEDVFSNLKESEPLTVGAKPNDNIRIYRTGYDIFDNVFHISLEKVRKIFGYKDDEVKELFSNWITYAICNLDVVDLGIDYGFESNKKQFIYTCRDHGYLMEHGRYETLIKTINKIYSMYGYNYSFISPDSAEKIYEDIDKESEGQSLDPEAIEEMEKSLGEMGLDFSNCKPISSSYVSEELIDQLKELQKTHKLIDFVKGIETNTQFVLFGLTSVLSANDGLINSLNGIISPLCYMVKTIKQYQIETLYNVNYNVLKDLGYVAIGFLYNIFKEYRDVRDENIIAGVASDSMYAIRNIYPMKIILDNLVDRAIDDGEHFHSKRADAIVSDISSCIAGCKVNISVYPGQYLTERSFMENVYGIVNKRRRFCNEHKKELENSKTSFSYGAYELKNNIGMIQAGSQFRGETRKPSLSFYFDFDASLDHYLSYIMSFYLKSFVSLSYSTLEDKYNTIIDTLPMWFKTGEIGYAVSSAAGEGGYGNTLSRFQRETIEKINVHKNNGIYSSKCQLSKYSDFFSKFSADIINVNTGNDLLEEEPCTYIDGVVRVKPSNIQELFSLRIGAIGKESNCVLGKNNDLYNFFVFLIRSMVAIGYNVKSHIVVNNYLPSSEVAKIELTPNYMDNLNEERDYYVLMTMSENFEHKIAKVFTANDSEVITGIKNIMFILASYYDIIFLSNSLATFNIYNFIVQHNDEIREKFNGGITRRNIMMLALSILKIVCRNINLHLNHDVYPVLLDTTAEYTSTNPKELFEYNFNSKLLNSVAGISTTNTKLEIEFGTLTDTFSKKIYAKDIKTPKPKRKKKSVKSEYESKSDIDYNIDYLNTDVDLNFVIKKLSEGKLVKCLIEGVPGSGKSEFAYHVAKVLGVDVNYINVSDYAKKYVGEGEERMTKLFDDAEKKGKLVIIDECDTLFTTRDDDKLAHYAASMTNHMLNEINKRNLNMFFTTNYLDRIDSAMIRRIDLKLKFGTLKNEYKYPLFLELVEKCSCKGKLNKEEISRRLNRIELTPGVFKSALNKLQWVESVTVEKAIEELEKESKMIIKEGGRSLGFCI